MWEFHFARFFPHQLMWKKKRWIFFPHQVQVDVENWCGKKFNVENSTLFGFEKKRYDSITIIKGISQIATVKKADLADLMLQNE